MYYYKIKNLKYFNILTTRIVGTFDSNKIQLVCFKDSIYISFLICKKWLVGLNIPNFNNLHSTYCLYIIYLILLIYVPHISHLKVNYVEMFFK